MSLKKYLILMVVSTLFCWLAFGLVVFFVSPDEAGLPGFALFYFSLWLALTGVFSIIGFIIRYAFKRHGLTYIHVKTAFRQGVMFGLLMVGALFLQGQKLLVWWNLLIFIGLLGVIEYFFMVSTNKSINREMYNSDKIREYNYESQT